MGFSDMLDEADRMILDGERGTVTVASAKWGFEARNEMELSFPSGSLIRVIEPHESGWWTGQCNGKTGFFPVNRTEPQVLDVAAYNEMQKRLLSSPMFKPGEVEEEDECPALPDPMLKAAQILGVTQKEAAALSPGRTGRASPRAERTQSVTGEELTSPRKALSVLGFDEENQGRKRGSTSSAILKMTAKVQGGFRRFTNGSGTGSRSNSISLPGDSPRKPDSPTGQGSPRSPREKVKFAQEPQIAKVSDNSHSEFNDTTVTTVTTAIDDTPAPVTANTVEEDSWGDDDVNEENLIY